MKSNQVRDLRFVSADFSPYRQSRPTSTCSAGLSARHSLLKACCVSQKARNLRIVGLSFGGSPRIYAREERFSAPKRAVPCNYAL
jgi:hypothetical protein